MKRLSSGEEKPGQTEVTGHGTGQGHSAVKGQGTAQGQGQPVKGEGHVRPEGQQGQPQAVEGEMEQRGKYFTQVFAQKKKKNLSFRPGPKVIKLFSCLTQLSIKFKLLINTKYI